MLRLLLLQGEFLAIRGQVCLEGGQHDRMLGALFRQLLAVLSLEPDLGQVLKREQATCRLDTLTLRLVEKGSNTA